MTTTRDTIRTGHEAITFRTDLYGYAIEYGPDAINATIHLDAGEARELAEAILERLAPLAEDRCPTCGSDDIPRPGRECVHCDGSCGCASEAECLALS